MNHNQSFYLIHNDWAIFNKLEEILSQIINDQGQKRVKSISELKKLERNIKSKSTIGILKYLQNINYFLSKLNIFDYRVIPEKIFLELTSIQNSIANYIAKIRTIRLVYKEPAFLSKISLELKKIDELCYSNSRDLLFKWSEAQSITEDNESNQSNESHQYTLTKLKTYENKASIFYSFEFLKESRFRLDFNDTQFSWIKNFKEIFDIQQSIKSSNFLLSEIFTTFDMVNHKSMGNKSFRLEFFFFLYELGVLKSEDLYSEMPKKEKDQIKRQLELFSNDIINQLMNQVAKEYEISYTEDEYANPTKEIPQTILEKLSKKQEQLTNEYSDDLLTATQILLEHGKILFEIIDQIEKRLENISSLMKPWPDVLKKSQQMIKHLRGEINRQLEDFDQYAHSIQTDSDSIILDQIIKKNILKMNDLINDYQKNTAPYIKESVPKIDELKKLIKDFQGRILEIKLDVGKSINRFKKKGVDVKSLLKNWDLEYEAILNRAKFSLKGMIISIFHQFNSILEKEQDFFDTLRKEPIENDLPALNSTDFLKPERLSEKELRMKIQKYSKKIAEIEDIKAKYNQEKEKLAKILETQLKENGLISGTCCICRKIVNVAEDNFIKCEFCGALTHYTCVVRWIEYHNSCPVCLNQYTIPNSGLFDPSQLEQ